MDPMTDIPGYAEAVEREQLIRNVAWIDINETICGIEVRPFTPQHHVALLIDENGFVTGGRFPNAIDVATFLWIVHPRYSPKSRWRRFFFLRQVRKKNLPALLKGIREYLDEAFMDAERGQSGNAKSLYALPVFLFKIMAAQYHTSPDAMMRMPYKKLFQLRRAGLYAAGYPLTNPSDTLRAKWRADQNAAALEKLREQGRTP